MNHILNLFGGDEVPYESAIPSSIAKRKITELELSLLHLQHNVEIEETHLLIHPTIRRAVSEALATNIRPSLSHISPKLLNDSTFLNTLHSHVNLWIIKSIQAVTKINRDVVIEWDCLARD
jgi:hypothetical protein